MRLIRDYEPKSELSRQFRYALVITLSGNILLAVVKSIAARMSGSSAIYADAVNSISDVLYSILLVIGLWLSQQPPDLSHPQGHSRFEPFAALIVTVSMAIAGVEAVRSSIVRFAAGGASIALDWPSLALILGIVIKVVMYTSVSKIGKSIASPGISAAARDNLSDVFTTLAAFIGILGSNFISPLLDPLAGLFVALWIFKNVWTTAKENMRYLTGAGADEDLRQKLVHAVQEIEGVENIHHILTDYAGPKLVVEMHINADGEISLNRSHAICDQATAALENLPEVDRAYVHVEPIGHV
jgi:cation diffusion facilitator family transporter